MNERIKELEKQCWSHRVDGALIDGHLHFDTKKFAELIVKECASIYDKIDNGNLHMGTDDYLEALHKTFFGVEK